MIIEIPFFCFCGGGKLVLFEIYFWLFAHRTFQVVLGGSDTILSIKLGSLEYKAGDIILVFSLHLLNMCLLHINVALIALPSSFTIQVFLRNNFVFVSYSNETACKSLVL